MRNDLVEAIEEFTGAILNPYEPEDLLQRLTGHAMNVLGAAGSGIMLEDQHGSLRFAAASDDQIVDIERQQGDQGIQEGVCHEAFVGNRIVKVEDIRRQTDPWPAYADRVARSGLRAVLGVPLNAFGRTIGVLDIYRADPGVWSPRDINDASVLAAIGAGYVVHAHELRAQHDLTDHLQAAIDSRDTIGQAKGILMSRRKLSAAEAFAELRRRSQNQNRQLREVAREIVEAAGRSHRPPRVHRNDHG